MPPKVDPKTIAANKAAAAAGGREVDTLGRKKSGPHVNATEEEEQTWTNPEDPSDTKVVWRPIPPDDRRCRAIIRSVLSPWRGNQCNGYAIHGGSVCSMHGGRLPNVKKAAQRRLAMAALPATERLIYMALRKKDMSDSDRLKALAMILDRAGIEGKSTVEIEIKPWQEALQTLFTRLEGEGGEGAPALTGSVTELEEGVDYDVPTIEGQWSDD